MNLTQTTSIPQFQDEIMSHDKGCENAVRHFLGKIKEKQHLNAFVEVYEEESLERARTLDAKRAAGRPLGKLYGVVMAVKDVICQKGRRVTAASAILLEQQGAKKEKKGFVSLYDSTVVQRLQAEDAIIIGNCNCDEFAMGSTNENSVYGPVRNALDESKVPGGSSGGSAVAVQAGMCMASLGSDTGGSVRQPADFCGIVGLKPSYGRVSRYGLIAYASSFDQVGIFANTVRDAALVLEVIAGADDYDSTLANLPAVFPINDDEGPMRIGWLRNALDHPSLDPEINLNIRALLGELVKEGHTAEAIDFDLIDHIVPAYYVLATAEASSNLSRFDGVRYGYRAPGTMELNEMYTKSRTRGFGKEVKRRIMLGTFVLSAGYYEAYFTKAQQVRRMLVEQTEKIFREYDAVLIPTSPSTAFTMGTMNDPVSTYLADIYTVFANLTGIPAISLPLFKHFNNMPYGLQIMSGKYNEVTLLNISERIFKKYKPA